MVNHFFSPSRAGRLTAVAVALAITAVPAIAQPEPVEPPQPDYELQLGGAEPAPGQACFFERYGYSGNEFCAVAGEAAMYLPGDWAREISSFQLGPGTVVEVCTDWALVNCTTFSTSEAELPAEIDDSIRSLRVSWAPDYTPTPPA